MKKRLLSMILALGMMLTILPVNAITAWAENEKIIKSGNCGTGGSDNVTYVLTQNNDDNTNKTYTLTISGNGKMNDYSDYSYNYAPWNSVNYAITQVVFEGDITTIGNYSFYRCTRLTSITIPNSVISIGTGAFLDCTGLKEITMPDDSNFKLHSIGAYAFEDCRSLKSITIPSSVQSIGEHAFYESFGSLKVYWPTVLSDHITVDDELGYNATYYYPGYKSAWDVQKSKISNLQGLNSVRYYCDVTIDANGGTFSDGTKTKVVKKVWSKENLTQEQVKAIGVPKNAQKAFFGWKYNPFYITENLENVVIEDSMTFCADYSGNTVTLGQLNNGNELVKGNSYEFTVTINTYCDDSGSPIKKLTFGDVAGTIKYKNSKIEGAEGLDITLPDGGKEKTLTFTFTPNEVGQNQTLTAYLDGLKYKEEEYGPVTSSTTYSVRDRQNAEVTITGLDNTTVKAGKAQDFTVNVTPNDDTIDKVTFGTTSGEVQWSSDNGNTWTTVSGDVDYSDLTGKQFRVVPAADAANGTVTVTVTAKKADGTEVAKNAANFTVTAREHATVEINDLNGETIKQNKAHTFTVTVTAHDDGGETTLKFDNVAGLTHNGTAVTDAGVTVALTKNQSKTLNFTLTPDAEGAGKTLTATLNNGNGAKDTATYTVSEYEHAKVTIDGLGTDLKQGESKDFTVKVDPKDDSGNAIIDFGDKNSEIQYKDGEDWKPMPSGGLEIDLSETHDFRITPKNDGSQTLTATVKQNDNELDRVEQTYTVAKKDEPTTPGGGENPGGGSTGGSENPGGGNTGDGDNTGDKDPETKSYELTVIGGSFTAKQGENALDVETTKENNTLTAKIPAGAVVTVTLNKAAVPEGMNFDQWNINDDTLMGNPKVAYDQESFHFTMPDHDVKVEVMYKDATIESDGPGILGTGALIATGVVGSAALLYQGHMLGTELYLRYLLPHGAVIPQNRAELAVLLWQDAENPEPVSTTLYSDISDEDSAIQQAARWAVENDLMEQLDAEEHPDHFDPFVPVTFSDSIRAWKKAQELKK